jgi:hypothetical protein
MLQATRCEDRMGLPRTGSSTRELRCDRTRLERDADLLGPKAATQPALLDEQARSLLDLAHPTDIVIVNDQKTER